MEETKIAESKLEDCCVRTLDRLSANNDMMLCTSCGRLIKIFREASPYRHFLTFCRTKQRPLTIGKYKEAWAVSYVSYAG